MPSFRGFDPHGSMRCYIRHMPHWRQRGATYFLTFRQVDSIPVKVLAEWLDLRDRWFRAHRIDPSWLNGDAPRFAEAYARIPEGVRRAFEKEQARLLHEELDQCRGSCVLQHDAPREETSKSLRHFHGERLWLGDFVVMPNHVHAIIQPIDDWELEDLLGSIKRFSSRMIGEWLKTQPESYDRIIRDTDELTRFRNYIADNAAKAKIPAGQFTYHRCDWL